MQCKQIPLKICQLPSDQRFDSLRYLPKLAMGAIWSGRPWPMGLASYVIPEESLVEDHYAAAFDYGIRMFDTAAAYGLGEERLGRFLASRPDILSQILIATKWNEEWDAQVGSSFIHSRKHLDFSWQRSLRRLPRVDLLYIHKGVEDSLANPEIKTAMELLVEQGSIRLTGASSVSETLIEKALASDDPQSLLWPDVIQTGAWLPFNRPDLGQALSRLGKMIVINSPIRMKPKDMNNEEALQFLRDCPWVSFVLTGTRGHLEGTIDCFLE